MNESSPEREPLERLAEEFAQRIRRGERPSIEEYAQKYPHLAEGIRDLFPTLSAVEEVGSAAGASHPKTAAPDARPPLRQLGEYRLLREVGRGGMGVVYEAVQESLGRHVALKVLPAGALLEPRALQRFQREAKAAARLHHTNIVPVFGVGGDGDVHYYAMQLIHGQSLQSVLAEIRRLRSSPTAGGPEGATENLSKSIAGKLWTGEFKLRGSGPSSPSLKVPLVSTVTASPAGGREPGAASSSRAEEPSSPSELASQQHGAYFRGVARLGMQVADALAYAHQHGVIHRDIKPSNLLLDTEGSVWITDFGLAKSEGSDDLTSPGELVGTLRYMAPERFRGISDPRGDIYSLGITLYEMLTLEPAFQDSDRARLVERISHEDPLPPRKIDADIPRDLETILLKATARNPADRYSTADDLKEDLRRFVEDLPIQARRFSLAERAWRLCRRHPALASVSGLALAALLAAMVLFAQLAAHHSHAAQQLAEEKVRTEKALVEAEGLSLLLQNQNQRIERQSAELMLDKGLALCERGDVAAGMLWMTRSLSLAADTDAGDLEEAVRANLAVWQRQIGSLQRLLEHHAAVHAVAMSRDGKTILTGSDDGTAQLWDAASGAPIGGPLHHQGPVRAVAISPDGKTLATGSRNDGVGEAWLWDAASGRPLPDSPLRHGPEVRALAFSPGGDILVTGSVEPTAQLWDVKTGRRKQTLRGHDSHIEVVAFSPDGRRVLTGSLDGTARLWETESGKCLHRLVGHDGEIWAAAFSHDGKTVLTGSLDQTARVWDAGTGKPRSVEPLKHLGAVFTVGFSPDGRFAFTSSDGTVRLWDPVSWRSVNIILKQQTMVRAAVFAPDSRHILTGARSGMAHIYRIDPPEEQKHSLAGRGEPAAAAFSPDGGRFVVSGEDQPAADLWALDGDRVRLVARLQQQGPVTAVAFSRDSRIVLTGSREGAVQRWDAATGQRIGQPFPHAGTVVSLAIDNAGRHVAVCDSHGNLRMWDRSTEKPCGADVPLRGTIRALAFSSNDTRLLTAHEDDGARFWDVTGPLEAIRMHLPHHGGCWAAAYSGTGDVILTGSGDGTAQLWDAADGSLKGQELRLPGLIRAVAFSPDSRFLLTSSTYRMVRVWHTATARAVGPAIEVNSQLEAVSFSPDGHSLLLGNAREVRVRRFPEPVAGDVERLRTRIEVLTGLQLEPDGAIRALGGAAWHERRQRLDERAAPGAR